MERVTKWEYLLTSKIQKKKLFGFKDYEENCELP